MILLAVAIYFHYKYFNILKDIELMYAITIVLYVIGAITIVISCLGIYGALKEENWPLVVYCVWMVLGIIVFLVDVVVEDDTAEPQKFSTVEEYFRQFQLDEEGDNHKPFIDMYQSEFQCCGHFTGPQDWGTHIPASCLCAEEDIDSSICQVVNASYIVRDEEVHVGGAQEQVYKMLVGLVLAVVLLCQMRKSSGVTSVNTQA
ncbi:23 kDa integral membrane protein-like [Megalops cyprinoides]|uniref:23 kDa integral membrane protein-like n=1 Tax=Megalops cyprinoides TaxID=118141 RepID=UPI0018655379|nr:23 kDa integral membrane protein-like [Megalops cyprinoides]